MTCIQKQNIALGKVSYKNYDEKHESQIQYIQRIDVKFQFNVLKKANNKKYTNFMFNMFLYFVKIFYWHFAKYDDCQSNKVFSYFFLNVNIVFLALEIIKVFFVCFHFYYKLKISLIEMEDTSQHTPMSPNIKETIPLISRPRRRVFLFRSVILHRNRFLLFFFLI